MYTGRLLTYIEVVHHYQLKPSTNMKSTDLKPATGNIREYLANVEFQINTNCESIEANMLGDSVEVWAVGYGFNTRIACFHVSESGHLHLRFDPVSLPMDLLTMPLGELAECFS